jgi:hypothetical protein
MPSSGTLCRVSLVRTDISEEGSAFIIRETRIGELRTLAVTSNRRALQRNICENGSVSTEYQIEDAERSGGSR